MAWCYIAKETSTWQLLASQENFRKILDRNNFFETVKLTSEDLKRPDSIRASIESSKTVENYGNYNEYLKSLEMKAEIKEVDNVSKDRFFQLINKTNQFNLTLEKINLNELSYMDRNNNMLALTASLTDKFSEYGIVSAIYGKITSDNEIDIKVWVMSCRVFKRTLEFAIFDKFAYLCKKLEIKKINGFFKKSDRNGIVENLYKELGFQEIKKTKNSSQWSLDIKTNLDFLNKKTKIYYE